MSCACYYYSSFQSHVSVSFQWQSSLPGPTVLHLHWPQLSWKPDVTAPLHNQSQYLNAFCRKVPVSLIVWEAISIVDERYIESCNCCPNSFALIQLCSNLLNKISQKILLIKFKMQFDAAKNDVNRVYH